jgi:hypothetical protein
MNHREIAESAFDIFGNEKPGYRGFKQYQKELFGITQDNPKEQPMTNEQKITNADKIKGLEELIRRFKAEIEELKKPRWELYEPTKKDSFCFMHENGQASTYRDVLPLTYSSGIYNWFKTTSAIQCGCYAKQRQIFDALANFAAHNDSTEKDRAWDGINEHWSIFFNEDENKYQYCCNSSWKLPTVVYFSTIELTKAALQMLKDERLI